MDTPDPDPYPRAMLPRLLLAALCLLPALARADAGPPTTSMATGASSTGDSTGASSSTGSETMPPEYTPCGCTHNQLGGGWSLALALLGAWSLRRRRA